MEQPKDNNKRALAPVAKSGTKHIVRPNLKLVGPAPKNEPERCKECGDCDGYHFRMCSQYLPDKFLGI